MFTNNISKYIKGLVVIAILLFIIIWLIVRPINWGDYWSCLGYTITLTLFISFLYNKWVWRWNPLEKTPKLQKSYTGIIYPACDGIKRIADIKIRQTLISLRIYLDTKESHSWSFTSGFYKDCDEIMLSYGYINKPKANLRDKSQIHYGMTILRVQNVYYLEGHYFNDRKMIGDIEFSALENKKDKK